MKDRILYRVVFLILTMVSGYAYADNTEDDTKTLLKDGRTWICAVCDYAGKGFPKQYVPVSVVGDTVINEIPCKIMESYSDPVNEKYFFYAYEEDGKIFRIIDNVKYYFMDFSAKEGDRLDFASNVLAIDEISVNGNMHRRFVIGSDPSNPSTYWIEGIGMSNDFVTFDQNLETCGEYLKLVEVWDNGEKIFTAEQFTPEKTYDDPYGETVREDRIWNYDFEDYLHPGQSEQMQCAGYHFDGTVIVDDRKYAVLKNAHNARVAYMREKDGRIYEFFTGSNYDGDDITERYDISSINHRFQSMVPCEYQLYGFNVGQTPEYMSVGFFYEDIEWNENDGYEYKFGFPTKVIVNGEATATLENGEDARLLYLSHDYGGVGFKDEDRRDYVYDPGNETMVIEGIGPDTGRLHLPEIISSEAGFGCFHYILNSVTDTEGNVIFERKDFEKYYRGSNVNGVAMAGADITVRGNAITATLQGSDLRITVYSVDGLMIASEQNPDTVEISGLPSGIYLVEAKTPGNTLKKKIIIR